MSDEADDWLPIYLAEPNGRLCDLRFRDALGAYDAPGPYFLHDDGHWYRVDPPRQVERNPTHFRPGAYDFPDSPSA